MVEYILVIVLIALAAYTEYDKWTRRCGPATESHRAGVNARANQVTIGTASVAKTFSHLD